MSPLGIKLLLALFMVCTFCAAYFHYRRDIESFFGRGLREYRMPIMAVISMLLVVVMVLPELIRPDQQLVNTFKPNIDQELLVNGRLPDTSFVSADYVARADQVAQILDSIQPLTAPGQAQPQAPQQQPPVGQPPAEQQPVPGQLPGLQPGQPAPIPPQVNNDQQYLLGKLTFSVPGSLNKDEVIAKTVLALQYVQNKCGLELSGQTTVRFIFDGTYRGYAYTGNRIVEAYTAGDVDRSVRLMAHEFGHQLGADNYPGKGGTDTILDEGLATYCASEYWLEGKPDFKAYHRDNYGDNFRSLTYDLYNNEPTERWHQSYMEWASFCDFLITVYGREKFDRQYNADAGGYGVFGQGDYVPVYGKNLQQLEEEWKAWMKS